MNNERELELLKHGIESINREIGMLVIQKHKVEVFERETSDQVKYFINLHGLKGAIGSLNEKIQDKKKVLESLKKNLKALKGEANA